MQNYTLTEAKAKLSELISRVHFGKEKFTITRKGKAVAMVSPVTETYDDGPEEGLIRAKGVLPEIDDAVDDMIHMIYANRKKALDREVDI
ncbi:MAG: type II toxin-antitoxin system Phd/YefM family antitoxin [Desulfobacterales bacterium]|nr:type II toxin-antitoxin system Phd/YefM family antitoxin [Desulfobacterales bacterium]